MKEKKDRIPPAEELTRTLADVARVDYFATQKLIRQIFIPGFDPGQYDTEIKMAYSWLSHVPNETSVLQGPHLPTYVKRNKFTIGLFIELRKEAGSESPEYAQPVAFGLSAKGLQEDIAGIKTGWKNGSFEFLDADLLSFIAFTKYWHLLKSRAKILQE